MEDIKKNKKRSVDPDGPLPKWGTPDGVKKYMDHTPGQKKIKEAKYSVDVDGLPRFYMDADSPAQIKKKLRTLLRKVSDIESVDRVNDAKIKQDLRQRIRSSEAKTDKRNVDEESGCFVAGSIVFVQVPWTETAETLPNAEITGTWKNEFDDIWLEQKEEVENGVDKFPAIEFKTIENVEVGDIVLGYSGWNTVTEVHHYEAQERNLVQYQFVGNLTDWTGQIKCTDYHPIMFNRQRIWEMHRDFDHGDHTYAWCSANPDLSNQKHPGLDVSRPLIGDYAVTFTPWPASLVQCWHYTCLEQMVETTETVPVYNLTVDGDHTYIVNSVVVHNKNFDEKLDPERHDAGDYVKDFRDSDAPQFKGKSDKKKRQMAIAAYLKARREKGLEEMAGHSSANAIKALNQMAKTDSRVIPDQISMLNQLLKDGKYKDAHKFARSSFNPNIRSKVTGTLRKHGIREENMSSEENISELKKSTYGSYIKKASKDAARERSSSVVYGKAADKEAPHSQGQKTLRKHELSSFQKSQRRQKGIERATDRLTREEKDMSPEEKAKKRQAFLDRLRGKPPVKEEDEHHYVKVHGKSYRDHLYVKTKAASKRDAVAKIKKEYPNSKVTYHKEELDMNIGEGSIKGSDKSSLKGKLKKAFRKGEADQKKFNTPGGKPSRNEPRDPKTSTGKAYKAGRKAGYVSNKTGAARSKPQDSLDHKSNKMFPKRPTGFGPKPNLPKDRKPQSEGFADNKPQEKKKKFGSSTMDTSPAPGRKLSPGRMRMKGDSGYAPGRHSYAREDVAMAVGAHEFSKGNKASRKEGPVGANRQARRDAYKKQLAARGIKKEEMQDESFKHYTVTHKPTGKSYKVTAMHQNDAKKKAAAQHGGSTASRYSGTNHDDFHTEGMVNAVSTARRMAGNMTGASKKIDKMKPAAKSGKTGRFSDNPRIAKKLQKYNEDVQSWSKFMEASCGMKKVKEGELSPAQKKHMDQDKDGDIDATDLAHLRKKKKS